MATTTLNLSLDNTAIWNGCEIEETAGRLNCKTPKGQAVNIIGRNVAAMDLRGDSIILTGPAPVWAYLTVFHLVVHRFGEVLYDDGRTGADVIAKHGA